MTHDWIARGKEVLAVEMEALQSVSCKLGAPFAEAVELLASCTGRVAVTGIGKSGLVGRKLAATLSSTGTAAFFLHPVEGAHGDLGAVREGDVIIAISHSGKSEELNAILPALRSLGARIIALTGGLSSSLANLADVILDAGVPREACPMNLVPTSSTTAALALGDALAVCLMEHKSFSSSDFKRFHPGGALGQRLSLAVSDIMRTHDLPVTSPKDSVRTALAALDQGSLGAVVIINETRRLLGILTDGDVRRKLARGILNLDAAVESIMTAAPRRAQPGQSAAELMDIMEQTGITVLPVVDVDLVLQGIVHMHDLLGKGRVKFAG